MDMDVSPSLDPCGLGVPSSGAMKSQQEEILLPSIANRKIAWTELVQHYLTLHLYDTARFYAERACYDIPTPENTYQLAQVYYQQGKIKQAYLVLSDSKNGDHLPSQYLLALCCVSLNKYDEAESVLSPKQRFASVYEKSTMFEKDLQTIPGGAAGMFLMGKICRRQQRHELAAVYLKHALETDPFLWSAVTELCDLGTKDDLGEELKHHFAQRFPVPPRDDENHTDENANPNAKNKNNFDPCPTSEPKPNQPQQQVPCSTVSDAMSASKDISYNWSAAHLTPMSQQHSQIHSNSRFANDTSDFQISSYSHLKSNNISQMSASQFSQNHMFLHGGQSMDYSQLTPIAASSAGVVRRLLGDSSVEYSAEKASQLALSALTQLHQSHFKHTPQSIPPSSHSFSATSEPGQQQEQQQTMMMTPSGILPSAQDVSAISMQIPFATPGSMPFSPISRSMLDDDDDMYHQTQHKHLPYAAHNSSLSTIKPQYPSSHYKSRHSYANNNNQNNSLLDHQYGYAQNTSLGFELGLSRIREDDLDAPASFQASQTDVSAVDMSMISGEASTLAPLRSQLFGMPTPDDPLGQTNQSHFQPTGNGRRRVSFGPSTSTRLSFSEAVLPVDIIQPHHVSTTSTTTEVATAPRSLQQPISQPPHQQNKVVTAGGDADEPQPSKLMRAANDDSPIQPASGHAHKHHHVKSSSCCSPYHVYQAQKYIITHIVAVFAQAYQHLTHYQGLECIQLLQTQLPSAHFSSALACQYLGRAYFDMNEYAAAVVSFKEMLRLEPFRVFGVEYLSSALWHLRKEHDLASLAQQVVDVDRLSAETWCVLGNCASLQKEAETALRFFQRAIQVDPMCTYAYTLSGHEHVANENMDKAIAAFRKALLCNMRHYNAWYGLGSIYYRQERYELAEYHFRQARDINRRSSVVDCYLGMVLNAQCTEAKVKEALQILADASTRFENNPQLRFQRAHILLMQDNWDEALVELEIVEKHAPKEPSVHALLGQIYQRLGRVQDSLLHFNIAMDLDPKEATSIKALMDNFEEIGISI